ECARPPVPLQCQKPITRGRSHDPPRREQRGTMASFVPHPDRLLPSDPAAREVAREIYRTVADAPIISPHGHVNPALLLDNEPFGDPAELLITPDHYITRVLFSGAQVDGDQVGRARGGVPSTAEPREIWRRLAEN